VRSFGAIANANFSPMRHHQTRMPASILAYCQRERRRLSDTIVAGHADTVPASEVRTFSRSFAEKVAERARA
jgi:hypothetical protein